MAKQSGPPKPLKRNVTIRLVPVADANNRVQDDSRTYEIVVHSAANAKNAFEVTSAATAGTSAGLKFHPADKLPSQADCYLQFWDRGDAGGNSDDTKRFDQYVPYATRDQSGNAGKNRFIGSLAGVLARDKQDKWRFVCLVDSGLSEVQQATDSLLPVSIDKGAETVVRKVHVAVDDECRWELGLHLTSTESERKFESDVFTYPVCVVESIRNLIRMQMAEGGISVGCYADLNVGQDDDAALSAYNKQKTSIQKAVDAALGTREAVVKNALKAAAQRRAGLDLPPLSNADEAKFAKEQREALENSGKTLRALTAARMDPDHPPLENYDEWRNRVIPLLHDAGPAAQNTLLAAVRTKYALTAEQIKLLADGGTGKIFFDLPAPDARPNASPKKLYNVGNDGEFAREGATTAREFGFITVKDGGGVTYGSRAVHNLQECLVHVNAVAAEVKKTYPEFCPDDGPPKIFRLAILTHGDYRAGLAFRSPENPEDEHWFHRTDLDQPEGLQFLDGLAACLAATPVIALYACNTGGNGKLTQMQTAALKDVKERLITETKEELEKKLAKIPANAKDRAAQEKKVRRDHDALLERRAKDEVVAATPANSYPIHLLSYGGDPERESVLKNWMGKHSFARAFRDKLVEKNIAADVWSHTDPGHTSRNSRLRLFRGDGTASDLICLVFADTAEFKSAKEPSQKQWGWWHNRGDEGSAPIAHQHAVKKAALCAADSIDDDQRAFSLKALIADFTRWYPGP